MCLGADVEIMIGPQAQRPSTASTMSKAMNEGLHLLLTHGSILFVSGCPTDVRELVNPTVFYTNLTYEVVHFVCARVFNGYVASIFNYYPAYDGLSSVGCV